jgi:ketosteroid isomerase-like protein
MTPERDSQNVELVRQFLQAIESGAGPEEMASFLHPEVHQTEFPNRLFAQGADRDLATLQAAGESGKKVVSSQRYEIRNILASGDRVAVEIQWTATINVPLGTLVPGSQMRAFIGQFFDLRDGKIIGIRNYDCYETF